MKNNLQRLLLILFKKTRKKDRIENNKNFKRNNLLKWYKEFKISISKRSLGNYRKDLAWLGTTESERIQNIVISSILLNSYKTNSDKHACHDYKYNLDVLEYMISSALELLEEKKMISSKEWRERMQLKIFKSS